MIDEIFIDEVKRMSEDGISIAVDFDSTICLTDGYPNILGPNGIVFDVLHKWQNMGCKIIMNTIRNGKDLENAVVWCSNCGFNFDYVNENKEYERKFGKCYNKLYATYYIDDKNVFTPLTKECLGYEKYNVRLHVDWVYVDKYLTPIIEEIIQN